MQRRRSHGHGAFFISFSGDNHSLARPIDVAQVKAAQLADTQSAAVEDFEDGSVACALGSFIATGLSHGPIEDVTSLIDSQSCRETLGYVGRR